MRAIFPLLTLLIIALNPCFSQSANAPMNRDYYHLIDRFEIMSGQFSESYHSHVKPIQRMHIAAFVDSLYANSSLTAGFSKRDVFNLQYLATDNWEWSINDSSNSRKPFIKVIYRKKPDFIHVEDGDFDLHVNPVIYWSGGTESGSDITTYTNTRGLDIRGNIAKRLGFYSFLTTTQAVYPAYLRNWTSRNGVIPHEGFWKDFKTNGVDYFTASGYLSFELIKKYITAQFGYDQAFHGAGHRSFIISDFAPGYTYLKFKTKIWRINYTNIFAQGIADQYYTATGSKDDKYPRKFIASHHLSINITDRLNIGLFESVIIGDSTEQFNISYLNPIIFYRALEHQGGSTDNAIVGMDAKWNIGHSFLLYGQLALDEFVLDEVKSGDGWWANKFGGQIGAKYINVAGINNLDLQMEYNVARPYMHAHETTYTNYAHYRQPLGHALGGNFKELVTIIRYQPLNRLFITAQLNSATYGDDDVNTNWGKDVMKSYNTREQEYGNEIGQGIGTKLLYGDIVFSYMWKHNLFFDVELLYRKLDSDLESMDENTTWLSGGVRWNMARKLYDF